MPTKIDAEAWMADRSVGIGCSDVPTIMWENPDQKPYELFLLKTGQKQKPNGNGYTAHGNKTEAEARQAYIDKEGLFMPPVTLQCTLPGFEFMRISLDGWEPRQKKIGLEIKCPKEPGAHRQAKEGHPPMQYWVQMQAQMCFAELESVDYWSYYKPRAKDKPDAILIHVPRQENYIETCIKPKVREFWQWMCERNYPMPFGEVNVADSPDFEALALAYREADLACERTERARDALRQSIAKLTHLNEVTTGYGIEVEWQQVPATEVPAYTRSAYMKMTVRSLP